MVLYFQFSLLGNDIRPKILGLQKLLKLSIDCCVSNVVRRDSNVKTRQALLPGFSTEVDLFSDLVLQQL
jgi:hypothetical protein